MSDTYRLLKNYIEHRHYRVIEETENLFSIRYQFSLLHIWFGTDSGFVTVAVSGFDDVDADNFHEVLVRCNKVNRDMKLTKIYTLKETIVASCEFYYLDEHDFEPLLEKAMNSVIDARGAYSRLKMGG